MLLVEPAPTRLDVHFRLLGFAVRIHPFFWLAVLLLGMPFRTRSNTPVEWTLTFVLVAFVSILIHELGHALAIRYFGGASRIILYHLGGLATIEPRRTRPFCDDDEETPLSARHKVLIALAGPTAGFLLAGLVLAVLFLTPSGFCLVWNGIGGPWWALDKLRQSYPSLAILVHHLLFVNIAWGLMNLLPVFPLDGGQVSRELFCLTTPRGGLEKSLLLSMVTGAVVAVLSLTQFGFSDGLFPALLFGVLAIESYRVMQHVRATGAGGAGYYGPEADDDDWWKK